MFVKVCGLTENEHVDWAVELGYTAAGIVLHPRSPRYIDRDRAIELTRYAAGRIVTVAVGVTFDEVRELYDHADYVQIYQYQKIERLIYAGHSMIEDGACDMFIFDSSLGSGEFGPFPQWAGYVSERLILSGGLKPDNVGDIVRRYHPYGVDVSSGVEARRGVKDYGLMKKFIDEVNNATG